MKTTLSLIILTVLASLSLNAQTQDKHSTMDHQKHMQLMEMMKDSATMDMMMSLIAADRQMRTAMIHKIAEHTESDPAAKQEACMTMMKGKGAHASEEGMGCEMMKKDEGTQGKEKQEKSHKH
jgi:hypothetical protein